MKESNYDFLCTSNTTQIKLAIQGDAFFSATIQSETAKKVDLSGGTRNLETLTFAHCLKLTRIIWPTDTGAIKRLAIHSAEAIQTLDLSALIHLEELSIFNCPNLEILTGLGKSLRIINAHGVNLSSIDTTHTSQLEIINLNTLQPKCHLTIKHLPALALIAIQGKQITCQVQACPALSSLLLISDSLPIELNVTQCPQLVDVCLNPNDKTLITGLEACEKSIQHPAASDRTAALKKYTAGFIAPLLAQKPGPEDMETVIQKFGTIRERNHACIIKISLLSSMETSFSPEPERQDSITKSTTRATLPLRDYPIIAFLPEVNLQSSEKTTQEANRFHHKEADVIDWLQNPNRTEDNPLVLNKIDLNNPDILNLLKQIEQRRQQLDFMGKQYPIPIMKKIQANFPRRLLKRGSPLLFNKILPAPASTPLPPPLTAIKRNLDKNLTDANLKRYLSSTLETLNARSQMDAEEWRQLMIAMNRFLLARKKLANIAQQHARQTAAATRDAPEKQHPHTQPLEAPPTLTDTPETKIHLEPMKEHHNTGQIEQELEHARRLPTHGKPFDAPPTLSDISNISVTLNAIDEDANINKELEGSLRFPTEGNPIQPPITLTDTVDQPANLLNLEQTTDINLELQLGKTPELVKKTQAPINDPISAKPALIDTSEKSAELENVSIDIQIFGQQLHHLCQVAKASAPTSKQLAEPVLLIEESIETALVNVEMTKKITINDRSNQLLTAAKKLSDALQQLNQACKTALRPTVEASERNRLIELLTDVQRRFAHTHQTRDPTLGTFGTGYKAGINRTRMTILNDLLQALKNNETKPSLDINIALQELIKDKQLKIELESELPSLKQHLTATHRPVKRK